MSQVASAISSQVPKPAEGELTVDHVLGEAAQAAMSGSLDPGKLASAAAKTGDSAAASIAGSLGGGGGLGNAISSVGGGLGGGGGGGGGVGGALG